MALGVGVALPARTLARAFTVFANDGKLAVPPQDGNFERSDACVPVSGRQIYSSETARAVQRMLRAVVESKRGTGQRAHLAYSAAGKTGTVAVLQFLQSWLVNHILSTDKLFGQYLRERGVT